MDLGGRRWWPRSANIAKHFDKNVQKKKKESVIFIIPKTVSAEPTSGFIQRDGIKLKIPIITSSCLNYF